MKSHLILTVYLLLMALMILGAILFPGPLERMLDQPRLFPHVLFVHIISSTLFFANALVGILWELRSLASNSRLIVLHTHSTVSWLDARFSSPLIIASVFSGLMLGTIMGGIWQSGWLSLAFLLFLFSGLVWIAGDIPSQYRLKSLMKAEEGVDGPVSDELRRILRIRLWISLAGTLPLLAVFALMIYKPELPPAVEWFVRPGS